MVKIHDPGHLISSWFPEATSTKERKRPGDSQEPRIITSVKAKFWLRLIHCDPSLGIQEIKWSYTVNLKHFNVPPAPEKREPEFFSLPGDVDWTIQLKGVGVYTYLGWRKIGPRAPALIYGGSPCSVPSRSKGRCDWAKMITVTGLLHGFLLITKPG